MHLHLPIGRLCFYLQGATSLPKRAPDHFQTEPGGHSPPPPGSSATVDWMPFYFIATGICSSCQLSFCYISIYGHPLYCSWQCLVDSGTVQILRNQQTGIWERGRVLLVYLRYLSGTVLCFYWLMLSILFYLVDLGVVYFIFGKSYRSINFEIRVVQLAFSW